MRTGRVRSDEVLEAQLLMRHPNRTGLVRRDGKFVAEAEPFHLRELEVLYRDARVSRFVFTSALSDDPLVTFRVRAGHGGVLRALLANTRGQRFEAADARRGLLTPCLRSLGMLPREPTTT